MLHLLGGGNQRGVEHSGLGVLFHGLLALFDQAGHALALLPLRRQAEQLEDFFEPLDLAFGLDPVLLEGGLQVGVVGGLGHLGECLEDLAFGVIDVLQFVDEQVVQRGKLGHG